MAMQYGRVAGVDKPISRILQGTSLQGPPDLLEQAREPGYMLDLFDGCRDLGITTFDTGHNYGGGIDLDNWENIDLEAYKLLAFHKFKTWYMENCDG